MYITMHFLFVLILLGANGLCMPFQKIPSFISSSSSSKLSALRKEMDDLMQFITINYLIDESDASLF